MGNAERASKQQTERMGCATSAPIVPIMVASYLSMHFSIKLTLACMLFAISWST